MKSNIDKVLQDRGSIYGDFESNSAITVNVFSLAIHCSGQTTPALYVGNFYIAGKISRLVNTVNHKDSWVDIAGYAKLIADVSPETREPTPEIQQEQVMETLHNMLGNAPKEVIGVAGLLMKANVLGTRAAWLDLADRVLAKSGTFKEIICPV